MADNAPQAAAADGPSLGARPRGRGRGGRGRGRGRAPRPAAAAGDAAAAAPATTADAARPARVAKLNPLALFVAGFGEGTEASTVGPMFEKYGPVKFVRLNARGVGRVDFETEDAANAAKVLNGSDYNGSKLRVETLRRLPQKRRYNRKPRPAAAPGSEGAAAPAAPAAAATKPRNTRPRQAAAGTEGAPAAAKPQQRQPRPPRPQVAAAAPAAPAEPKPLDPTRVFVGGLDRNVEDDAIKALFTAVASFERSRNKFFAIVQFNSAADADKAVADGAKVGEKALKVAHEDPNLRGRRRPRAAGDAPRAKKPRTRKPVDPALLDSKRLYFGYLPENTDADKIKSNYAGVSLVELRGKYAYVTFDSDASATAAIASGKKLGEEVRVEVASRPPRAPKADAGASAAAAQ